MATIDGLSSEDQDLILAFACSLDESPGKNWVENAGGLPDYICRIARAIKKTGKTTSEAISIAVSRVKVWASGKGVDKDTQGKAAAALAEWEKLRAKSHAKTAAKDAAKDVKASAHISDADLLRIVAFTPRCEFSALDRVLMLAADKSTGKQYGNVTYADTTNKKYPIDTKAHVQAAWSYINQSKNQSGYSSSELAAIKSRIKTAAKKFGISISGD